MEAFRRTYVLVHGAFHGGWCWKDVAARLRAAGHEVYTPTWTGLGERSHLLPLRPTLETFIEDVAQVIRYEDLDDVVLVGHSFAGSVVSSLADRMSERLRHLVYLDALVLQSGESSADRSPDRIEVYRQRAMASSEPLSIPPAEPAAFGVTDPAQAAWVASKITPHPLQSYYDRLDLKNPLTNGVPATYIACSNPYFTSTVVSRQFAQQAPGWRYQEIATAHDAMLLLPDELTAMLLAIE
ncbi:alpha/beta fold hydrolase [Hydrogenophaga sp.]|uniref:alpha/beta fold hydrolase n=1 Tax=Hydrogenophaga sp. TaxID=1904254 RepID=UPI0027247783|nr:alpha/beta fold hydrolase [Hydrogenophaga sp.]MDO9437057.1 alpha/beta fold hydrolase [Hydrogenophaga sp.]